METTEKKLKTECHKRGYFCKKIPTHTATGHGSNQEADFIIAKKEVYFIECKECAGKTFSLPRFTQKAKLKRVTSKTNAIKPFILINFINEKKIILLSVQMFEIFEKSAYFKNGNKRNSLNVELVPDEYIYNWKRIFETIV